MSEITQADRDAAARYWGNDNPPQELQREFARHRMEERAALVAEIVADLLKEGSFECAGYVQGKWGKL